MDNKTRYVLGFAFSRDSKRVLLIAKKRPARMVGKWNGIGGHIEGQEFPVQAMVREFKEETDLDTKIEDWREYAVMEGPDWICYCFAAYLKYIEFAKDMTDEITGMHDVSWLPSVSAMPNINYLIKMALDKELERVHLWYD